MGINDFEDEAGLLEVEASEFYMKATDRQEEWTEKEMDEIFLVVLEKLRKAYSFRPTELFLAIQAVVLNEWAGSLIKLAHKESTDTDALLQKAEEKARESLALKSEMYETWALLGTIFYGRLRQKTADDTFMRQLSQGEYAKHPLFERGSEYMEAANWVEEHGFDPKKQLGNTSFIRHCGYVVKKGGVVKNWKRRWLVLWYDKLSYYISPEFSAKPKGTITLKEIKDVAIDDKTAACCFTVATKKRKYFIRAEYDRDRDKWVAAIKDAIAFESERENTPRYLDDAVAKADPIAAAKLAVVATHEEGRQELVEHKAVARLLRTFADHPEAVDFREKVLCCLRHMYDISLKKRKAMNDAFLAADGIDLLVPVLAAGQPANANACNDTPAIVSTRQMKEFAIQILARLVDEGAGDLRERILGNDSLLEHLISAWYCINRETKCELLRLLATISTNEQHVSKLVEHGALRVILEGLHQGAEGLMFPVSRAIIRTIVNLSRFGDEFRSLFSEGDLHRLIQFLHSRDNNSKANAATAIQNISLYMGNSAKLARQGAIEVLAKLLSPKEDEVVQQGASGALRNLTLEYEKNRYLVARTGVIKRLIELTKSTNQIIVENVSVILLNLSKTEELDNIYKRFPVEKDFLAEVEKKLAELDRELAGGWR